MKVSVRKTIIAVLVIAIFVCFVASWYVNHKQSQVAEQLTVEIYEVQHDLVTLASSDAGVVADKVSSGVLKDCGNRSQYNDYLSRLNTLVGVDLIEAKNLHLQCGSYRPAARSIKAALMQEKVDRYSDLTSLRELVDSEIDNKYKLSTWLSIVEKEQEIATLLAEQSSLQLRIIDAIINDDATEINELVLNAQDVKGLLDVVSIKQREDIDEILSI